MYIPESLLTNNKLIFMTTAYFGLIKSRKKWNE